MKTIKLSAHPEVKKHLAKLQKRLDAAHTKSVKARAFSAKAKTLKQHTAARKLHESVVEDFSALAEDFEIFDCVALRDTCSLAADEHDALADKHNAEINCLAVQKENTKVSDCPSLVGEIVRHVKVEETRVYITFNNGATFVIDAEIDDENYPYIHTSVY